MEVQEAFATINVCAEADWGGVVEIKSGLIETLLSGLPITAIEVYSSTISPHFHQPGVIGEAFENGDGLLAMTLRPLVVLPLVFQKCRTPVKRQAQFEGRTRPNLVRQLDQCTVCTVKIGEGPVCEVVAQASERNR